MNIRTTSGPAIDKPGDLVALLNELQAGDVLFIDEIHRLPKVVEEMLYSAMEDFYIDIVVGQGPAAHPVHFPLPPFTLIGATTRAGALSAPCATGSEFLRTWPTTPRRSQPNRDPFCRHL